MIQSKTCALGLAQLHSRFSVWSINKYMHTQSCFGMYEINSFGSFHNDYMLAWVRRNQNISSQILCLKIKLKKYSERGVFDKQKQWLELIQIHTKWEKAEKNYKLRNMKDLNVPKKPSEKCTGFSYNRAELFNSLPSTIKETEKIDTIKTLIKK